MEQILMRIMAYTYCLIALPAMAIIGIAYYNKKKNTGGLYFMVGAIATAIGSMFNQLFPKHLFIDKSTGFYLPAMMKMGTIALIIHLLGFLTMVAAWGIITFTRERKTV